MVTTSASPAPPSKLHPLAQGLPPPWAWEWGEDQYGPWCSFRIKGVSQRLRWIPPGRFVMGSPPEEVGRYKIEDVRRYENEARMVRIPVGFWLFDTPCTQALWEAVTGENPSHFRSPNRPVEQVSWLECQRFVENLNGLLDGLTLSLPSEAQWEYACRAGTTAATYAGDLQILGYNNAPVLDGIAWYLGNCGVDFELDEGWDISEAIEMQYDRKKGGTHPVGGKAPNAWGLFDMLGNVWEWCEDEDRVSRGTPTEGLRGATPRMVRGGSWYSAARQLRAAFRLGFDPAHRNALQGFRCGEFRAGEEE